MDNAYDSPTLFANQSNSSLPFNQSEASSRSIRAKDDQRPLAGKNYFLFPPPLSSPEKNHFHEN